jgi:DNA-binding Xre family transcriptional regulator
MMAVLNKPRTATIRVRLRELTREKTIRDGRNPEYQLITQEEVADAIGISRATMSDWSRDKVSRLDRDILAKLCVYFECRIEDLLLLEIEGA